MDKVIKFTFVLLAFSTISLDMMSQVQKGDYTFREDINLRLISKLSENGKNVSIFLEYKGESKSDTITIPKLSEKQIYIIAIEKLLNTSGYYNWATNYDKLTLIYQHIRDSLAPPEKKTAPTVAGDLVLSKKSKIQIQRMSEHSFQRMVKSIFKNKIRGCQYTLIEKEDSSKILKKKKRQFRNKKTTIDCDPILVPHYDSLFHKAQILIPGFDKAYTPQNDSLYIRKTKKNGFGRQRFFYSLYPNYDIFYNPRGFKQQLSKRISELGGYRLDFGLKDIEIEFNNGYIENIVVDGRIYENNYQYDFHNNDPDSANFKLIKVDTLLVKLQNYYPIGFSRKRDLDKMKDRRIFSNTQFQSNYSLDLNTILIDYIQKHEIDRRDFSPANQIVSITYNFKDIPGKEKYHYITLNKRDTEKLFQANIFSDFQGLNANSPNGIIQTEISKRIPLATGRWPRRVGADYYSFAFLEFIRPKMTIAKLEETNRALSLEIIDRFTNNVYDPLRFTSTLKLKQHEFLNVGFDLNIALMDIPSLKSIFYINSGISFGRTEISEEVKFFDENQQLIDNNIILYNVNGFTWKALDLLWRVKPDERYMLDFRWALNKYYLLTNDFKQVANIPTFSATLNTPGGVTNKYFTSGVTLKVKLDPSATGTFFFRYNYNWQAQFRRTGFHQTQVGYSVLLVRRFTNKN